MDLELVTVGSELLLGFTLDTNAAEIARALASVGARVTTRTTVGDSEPAIRDAVAGALRRTGLVVVTGGLGPTSDDVTKKAVAGLFDAPLELDQQYLRRLEQRFARLGRGPMPPSNRTQAEFPRGATVLPNRRGTAPALWLDGAPGTAVLLPGVPHEMRALLREELIPRVRSLVEARHETPVTTRWRTLRTTGTTESAIASALADLEAGLAPVTVAYLPGFSGVDLRLMVSGLREPEADAALHRAAERVLPVLDAHYYGEGDTDLAMVVLDQLRARRMRLAVAESCTGGLIGARITAIPGSSEVFAGGVVSYADDSKVRDLEVPGSLLEAHGAVSEPVVRAMMAGAARRFGVEASVAVTGIAGPAGGSEGKPVGTVWLAARAGGRDRAVLRRFPGGREAVRQRSAQAALDLLRRLLSGVRAERR
ncbi:MAG: competence/damage-inducible protein A [Gemmatimonadales bacterium]|nr:competence/damage-inducible protein A [Gemmatimonadales bacterium]NIN11276.1 competence/damage-inducible protein A [Gemmatimonadales bacterium]NIN49875.1 competence/damage-inducible protein A [Gemmatimonadales bacterium]NIP07339.1 competence/damage-inducible protein A [Gemmatimonadales bacterium]NIR03034.1 competence/damage-inducible protein A [Gemmatimonadales bacterium]